MSQSKNCWGKSPDLKGAMYVSCTNKTVIRMNYIRLSEMRTELHEISAKHMHPTMKELNQRLTVRVQ